MPKGRDPTYDVWMECGTCSAWEQEDKRKKDGECHRNPPSGGEVIREKGKPTEVMTLWPPVTADDWCVSGWRYKNSPSGR